MTRKIAVFSGGYDPLHTGHLAGFFEAENWADMIIIGPNSDEWLKRKKGFVFMPWEQRALILNSLDLACPHQVWAFSDEDDTAETLLEKVANVYYNDSLYFCNGGDRDTCPEIDTVTGNDFIFLFHVGGGKVQSSSRLVFNALKQIQTEEIFGNN
jgi:cytidyltransferase-like protein